MRTMLAVDLGLKTGLALFSDEPRLIWYRSQNYGSAERLKRAAYSVIHDMPDLSYIVIEGGGVLARPWALQAAKHDVEVLMVSAHEWRAALLKKQDQGPTKRAKRSAESLAPKVIDALGGKRPTSLRHDAAEAILVGLWAMGRVGWIDRFRDYI